MNSPLQTRDKLLKIVEPVCTGSGYELVDIKVVTEGSCVVRVFIEYAAGSERASAGSINCKDCENISRELSAVLDVEDPISGAYRLEVSSPGVDRPLRTADHFRRFAGQRVKITLSAGVEGRRNFTGVLLGLADSDADADASDTLRRLSIEIDVEGTKFRLPLDDLHNAKLIPDWDRLMSETN